MEYELKRPTDDQSDHPEPDHVPAGPDVTPVVTPTPTTPDPLNLSDLAPSDRDQAAETAVVKKHKNKRAWRDFGSFVIIVLLAILLSWAISAFVFRSYSVDGPSMETTLMNNDKLVIWKTPRTLARITGHQYVPGRGDIVVFHLDDLGACGQTGGRDIIKRVIGLPGERVTVANNVITVYNKEHPAGFQPDATLPYNKDHHLPTTNGNVDETVAANQIFVAGDNRPASCDSRFFGPVDLDNIVGKLIVRVLPITKAQIF